MDEVSGVSSEDNECMGYFLHVIMRSDHLYLDTCTYLSSSVIQNSI